MNKSDKKYRSIFLSDIHLGTYGCNADELTSFLRASSAENLYLVGDIFDGWRLKKRCYFPQSHMNVVIELLTASRDGCNVIYLLGDHDEDLKILLPYDINLGEIKMLDSCDYLSANHKRYLITHGDIFDSVMVSKNNWLRFLGDNFYNWYIFINTQLNPIRRFFEMNQWSLSKYLKRKKGKVAGYIKRFEERISMHCYDLGYDGIICGHIHLPAIKRIDKVEYMNCGDWVESSTALVEHHNGKFELISITPTDK
jgi:UDP-2,3-diacylglucosamine pyrophosphatase LpxH